MEQVAKADKFRHIFYGDPGIGGRYSVLSNFGMVAAAVAGIDVKSFLSSAQMMVNACSAGTPPDANPGVQLGTILGMAALCGHDKLTIIAAPAIADFGAWLEQLVAESTGKNSTGIVPIDGEPVLANDHYGSDRLFAYLRVADQIDPQQEAAVAALEKAGQPVIRVTINGHLEIAQLFFLWEFAIAVTGSVMGIHVFDQPDVEASKIETKKLTEAYTKTGKLPDESPFLTEGQLSLFADAKNADAVKGGSFGEAIKKHLARINPGDYFAVLGYIERNHAHIETLQAMRVAVLEKKHVATVAEFGPRFLHSTGQAYKGGPNSGVFMQITADDAHDLAVPGEKYSFSIVKAAQARGDFDVLSERGRRALRVHISGDLTAGLAELSKAIHAALG
jgi:transaldolase/glucose-6-phosphate isomerase